MYPFVQCIYMHNNIGTASFSCDFAVDGSDVVASNCQAVGFIPSSIECQVDDQPAVTCELYTC